MRIKDIPPENRPRERLQRHGQSTLSDAELLAVILGSAGKNVIETAHELISRYGLARLSSCSLTELRRIDGIGEAKASLILALFELVKRQSMATKQRKPIRSPQDVYDFCYPLIGRQDKEHFMVIHLDTRNRVIKYETISIGTLNSSLIHPREVFKSAIKDSANTLIIVHNHPSGDPTPSEEDKEITQNIFKAGKLLSINVLDHVIIGDGTYHSLKD